MAKTILVHGMNATNKSWNGIESDLDNSEAILLKGHTQGLNLEAGLSTEQIPDLTYAAGFGMEEYVASVVAAFPNTNACNVWLVGHSMGGAVISHVAAQYPDRIAGLVYLAAMLPLGGQSAAGIKSEIEADDSFDQLKFVGYFLWMMGKTKVVLQPREPLAAKFERNAKYDALPRYYIPCQNDVVIPLVMQNRMIKAYEDAGLNITALPPLNNGHLPQHEDAAAVVAALENVLT